MNNSILYSLVSKFCPKELDGNTIYNIDLSLLNFLHSKEGELVRKGEKPSKSYYYENYEVARIDYIKLVKDHTHEGKVYKDVFIGTQKRVNYFDYHGKVAGSKTRKPYFFNLISLKKDGVITGFTSSKMRKILADERREADYFLQSKSPDIYAILYNYYSSDYEFYLRTGDKSKLVTSVTNETRTDPKKYLDDTVSGMTITVRELIIANLQ